MTSNWVDEEKKIASNTNAIQDDPYHEHGSATFGCPHDKQNSAQNPSTKQDDYKDSRKWQGSSGSSMIVGIAMLIGILVSIGMGIGKGIGCIDCHHWYDQINDIQSDLDTSNDLATSQVVGAAKKFHPKSIMISRAL